MKSSYIGRFAPSPNGLLHNGSVAAALASYIQARQKKGKWLLRIDDIDNLRAVKNFSDEIISSLWCLGFRWDGPIIRQSRRIDHYKNAITKIEEKNMTYSCYCSRREIKSRALKGVDGFIYPGTCENKYLKKKKLGNYAIRVKTENKIISFDDTIQKKVQANIKDELGDFIIQRQDGIISYQLAVVVDDYLDGITNVVRGSDLIFSTLRQIYLNNLLKHPLPIYTHIPLALDENDKKLSKSRDAPAINKDNPLPCLIKAWNFLKQEPIKEPIKNINDFWIMALSKWSERSIKDEAQINLI